MLRSANDSVEQPQRFRKCCFSTPVTPMGAVRLPGQAVAAHLNAVWDAAVGEPHGSLGLMTADGFEWSAVWQGSGLCQQRHSRH